MRRAADCGHPVLAAVHRSFQAEANCRPGIARPLERVTERRRGSAGLENCGLHDYDLYLEEVYIWLYRKGRTPTKGVRIRIMRIRWAGQWSAGIPALAGHGGGFGSSSSASPSGGPAGVGADPADGGGGAGVPDMDTMAPQPLRPTRPAAKMAQGTPGRPAEPRAGDRATAMYHKMGQTRERQLVRGMK